MQCISCNSEIDPKWSFAIEKNNCPFCGKEIMEEKLKSLLSVLKSTMIELSQYQNQLNDWMKSNHNYIKTDDPNLVNYVPKELLKKAKEDLPDNNTTVVKMGKDENGKDQEMIVKKVQSEEKTQSFFKRAKVKTPQDKDFKEMVQQIKRSGGTSINEDGSEDYISAEMMEDADPEAVSDFEHALSGSKLIAGLDGGDEIPAAVLAMAQGAKGNVTKDMIYLQQMQEKSNNARENLEFGNNRGKNSFSRSG